MRKFLILSGLALLLVPGAVLAADNTAEEEAVRAAAFDYIDGFYKADMTYPETD